MLVYFKARMVRSRYQQSDLERDPIPDITAKEKGHGLDKAWWKA